MILRIFIFVVTLASQATTWPDSIPGYNDAIQNSRCATGDETEPSFLYSYFVLQGSTAAVGAGPFYCSYLCDQIKSCSGFAFSFVEKNVCELSILDDHLLDGQAFANQRREWVDPTTGDAVNVDESSWFPVEQEDSYATQGAECNGFGAFPYCLNFHDYRCYIRITSEPTLSPSTFPSTSPSKSPSFSPSVIPSDPPSSSPTTDTPSTRPSLSPSVSPTKAPTTDQPSITPTSDQPSLSPSQPPSKRPSTSPSNPPTKGPTNQPTFNPTADPSSNPTLFPTTDEPSTSPSNPPTKGPTNEPTFNPTTNPTLAPTTDSPSTSPSFSPSTSPSKCPTSDSPSASPSKFPTSDSPSTSPSEVPTKSPSTSPTTDLPSNSPTTEEPTVKPSTSPTVDPSNSPVTSEPSLNPSVSPSYGPSEAPSVVPSESPTKSPSTGPTVDPTLFPIGSPSTLPSDGPSRTPTVIPTDIPSTTPTKGPTKSPETSIPSVSPTVIPSDSPSVTPTRFPSTSPSVSPSEIPSYDPSVSPSCEPSESPSLSPSTSPSQNPTSSQPTTAPSRSPSTTYPSQSPVSSEPTVSPSPAPSVDPTIAPTTDSPSTSPSNAPTRGPTTDPSTNPSRAPTANPSHVPSVSPSFKPSTTPTQSPSKVPSLSPSSGPSVTPTQSPSKVPSLSPSSGPSVNPTQSPSKLPTVSPSLGPSTRPTVSPSHIPSLSPTETNPCSGPSDSIVGSKYVKLDQDESSFSNSDDLCLTLQIPDKYTIEKISFEGGTPSGSYNPGSDNPYWRITTKEGLECLTYPKFCAAWTQVVAPTPGRRNLQSDSLIDFRVVTEDDKQYLFNKMTLELEENVYSDIHDVEFNRKVIYEMPFAIELQSLIELEVDMTMIIPTVSPTVGPSGQPSVTPTSAPSTSPSGAPTLKAMDHLFTRHAVYAPDINGNSLVDINFTTIVRLPWTVQDQEFYIIDDDDDAMVDDSQVFTLLEDCYSAFQYTTVTGACVDENWRYPPYVFTSFENPNPDICKTICDQTDACEAYDVSADFKKCSIIGVNIDSSFTTSLQPYLEAGESWTFTDTGGGSPTQGRPLRDPFFCNIKQTAAWQTDLCASDNGVPPHPEDVPECYCYQEWNLKYTSGNVCDVSGWWTLGMTIESSETGNNLFYETRVWVGLTTGCATVIGSSEICPDEAPCSISGLDDDDKSTSNLKFYTEEQAHFKVIVGGNAPIANIEISEMKLQQQDVPDEVTVPPADYRIDGVVASQISGFDNRFTATADLILDVNEPTFTGSIAGVASVLTVTAGITYVDGVTRRRQLSIYTPEGDKPSVDLEIQILVYPKRCLEPAGNLGSHLVRTCAHGKTIRVCRASGWETLVEECPDEEADSTSEVTTDDQNDTQDVTNTQQDSSSDDLTNGSEEYVTIKKSSDNNTASLWKLLTVIAAGVVLLVVCGIWYGKLKEDEDVQKKIVQRSIEAQYEDSEYDTTDYSITDTSYYQQDKANQEIAMKMAYEEIFQQFAHGEGESYAPSVSQWEQSDV